MDLNIVNRNEKLRNTGETAASESESGCSLAVGADGGFPVTAAKSGNFSTFSGSVPIEAAELIDTCHTPSTVVGISGLVTDNRDVISPTAEDDPTMNNALAMFKKDNGENLQSSLCEPESLLVSQEDHSIEDFCSYKPTIKHDSSQQLENQSSSPAQEDTHCNVESDCSESITRPQFSKEESMKESDDEENLMRVYVTPKAEASQWSRVDATSVTSKSEEKKGDSSHEGNALLPSSIPEASVESIPEHRRVDSGSLSTIQQHPIGEEDYWNSKALSHPTEKMKLQTFQSPYSEEAPDSDTKTASLIEEEEREDSSDSEEYKNDISFEAPVDALNDDYREGKNWIKGKFIGEGASACCYLATDLRTNKKMAVKQIDRKKKNDHEIKFEVGILRSIRHNNVVQFKGASPAGNVYNIFMEYMPGGSVADLLIDYVPLPEPQIHHYIKQLLKAVIYLHGKSIALREIRSAHLMLNKTRKVLKVIDFGSAAKFDEKQKFCEVVGTLLFMAPEVKNCDGITPYTSKADIWSIGCVMMDMAWPYYGPESITMLVKLGNEIGPFLRQQFGNSRLQMMMELCLQVDPNKRPTTRELYNYFSFSLESTDHQT